MNHVFKAALFAILLVSFHAAIAQKMDSLQIYFPLNDRNLSKTAQHTIDSLIYNNVLIPGQSVVILGYADYLGSKPYNIALSRARAENVKSYLEQSGFAKENIKLVIGKGKIERSPEKGKIGYPDDRKVQVVIEKSLAAEKPSPSPVVQKSKDITKLNVNETLTLNNIYFLPGSHEVREESLPTLDTLYNILDKNKKIKIQIEGHICCEANTPDGYDIDLHDYNLSLNRAKAIYDYLEQKGIDPERMKYKGFGKTRPLVPIERTTEDQNKNRRVEIRILEK
ncbi:MAG TPA: OmpA family protein [Flavipsychrobacter sp.]|nr:OmpA family protein [Flavipsychrobacter sp.]